MVEVIYQSPEKPAPAERHIVVVVHEDVLNGRVREKAYFYDSAKGDKGGSGPFDFLLDEAMERAKRFASDHNLTRVVVRAKQP